MNLKTAQKGKDRSRLYHIVEMFSNATRLQFYCVVMAAVLYYYKRVIVAMLKFNNICKHELTFCLLPNYQSKDNLVY